MKYFSLTDLNDAISSFPHRGVDRTNKPTLIIQSGNKIKLKQTASQSLCLVRLLPLYIEKYLPEDDKHWSVFCSYLSCLDFILAPKLSNGEIECMRIMIESFMIEYFRLNPDICQ